MLVYKIVLNQSNGNRLLSIILEIEASLLPKNLPWFQMARTQKNKATMGHLGLLKAKLAKLKRELITPKGGGAAAGEGFDVAKTGDARIGFVGELPFLCFVLLDV